MKKRVLIALVVVVAMLATASVVWADPDEWHVYSGESIQDAVNSASDGDVVYVHEGTYNEAVVIDGVDVSLLAVGSVTLAPSSCSGHGDVIQIYNAVATVDGFTIDANYSVSGCLGGIYARGMAELGETAVDVTIRNNTVEEYGKNGITVNGELATGRIFNNTVTGRDMIGYGDYAQNGIQLGLQATGIVRGNTVSDNWYTGGYWTASNILLSATMDVQVLNNTLVDGQTGIYVYGTNIKVTGNSIDGEPYGPYPADWPPQYPPQNLYDYGSWGVILYGDNNKVVRNTIGPYDVGVENYLVNNKVIHNTFNGCEKDILDFGEETKVHANATY
jgi:hypothetical protein